MKTNSKLVIAGILGMSLNAQAQELGVNLIKKESLDKLAQEKQFPDMTQSLIDSQIIRAVGVDGYYLLNTTRLKEEKSLAINEGHQDINLILDDIFQLRVKVSLKKFKEMHATSQDHSPFIKPSFEDKVKRFERNQREP